jgi:hypothetical protein
MLNEQEISDLMSEMESLFHGHPRLVILFALHRSMAAMLGPAEKQTREDYIRALPNMLNNILKEMDEMLQ